jgi:hypothetical protein
MPDDPLGFAAPSFRPDEALQRLKRELRDLGLGERQGLFERRGLAIARLQLDDGRLMAARVRQPSRNSPQWQSREIASHAALREFVADLKKAMQSWRDGDE